MVSSDSRGSIPNPLGWAFWSSVRSPFWILEDSDRGNAGWKTSFLMDQNGSICWMSTKKVECE
jgi:hypothetical protein